MIGLNESGCVVGESHHKARLTQNDVDNIRELREEYGLEYKQIAEKFEVGTTTIFDICAYKTWVDVPVRWVRVKDKKSA